MELSITGRCSVEAGIWISQSRNECQNTVEPQGENLGNHFGRARLSITNHVTNITAYRIIYAQHRTHRDRWVFFIHLNLLISMSSMQSASHPIFLLWEEPHTRGTQWISATPTRRFARCFQAFTHSSIPVVLLHPCLDLWTLHIVESVREMWLKRHGVLWFYFSSPWTFTSALESLKSTPTLTAAVLPHRCPGGISAK